MPHHRCGRAIHLEWTSSRSVSSVDWGHYMHCSPTSGSPVLLPRQDWSAFEDTLNMQLTELQTQTGKASIGSCSVLSLFFHNPHTQYICENFKAWKGLQGQTGLGVEFKFTVQLITSHLETTTVSWSDGAPDYDWAPKLTQRPGSCVVDST